MKITLLLTLLLTLSTTASPTLYVAPTGTDAPTYGSLTSPLRTLSYASSILPSSGGIIRMFEGVYSGAKLSTQNVSITPHPDTPTSQIIFNSTLSVAARGVKIAQFTMEGLVETSDPCVEVGSNGSVVVSSATFANNWVGIQVSAGGKVEVVNSSFDLRRVDGYVGMGIRVVNPSTGVEDVAGVSVVSSSFSGSSASSGVSIMSTSSDILLSHVNVANVGSFLTVSSGLPGVTTSLSVEHTNVTHGRQGIVISKPYYGIQGEVSISNTVFANMATDALTNFERGGLGLFVAGEGLSVSIDRALFYNVSVAGDRGLGGSLSCQDHAALTLTNSAVVSSYAYTDGAAFCDSSCSFTGAGNSVFLIGQSETKGHCNDLR